MPSSNLGYFRLSDLVRRDEHAIANEDREAFVARRRSRRRRRRRTIGEVRGPYRIMRIEEKERGG